MKLSELYKLIGLPDPVIKELNIISTESIPNAAEKYIPLLTEPKYYEQAERELSKLLSPDTNGFKMLYVMLKSALISYDKYTGLNIPEEIYAASMKSFTRFISESFSFFGHYAFDRSWWSGRFLSLTIFRIGELEYEILSDSEEISIHIPSDADLSNVDESINESREFFSTFFPQCESYTYVCLSWLLSPALDLLLNEQSKILKFKSKFKITDFYPNDEGYKQWIFKNSALSPENFPEETTLQKKAKSYVLSGGKIGEAKGILI